MGDIFRAYDPVLRRRVALKVLRRDVMAGDLEVLKRARARLLREARAAAVLHHPNAVAIFDVGEVDDTPFLAMELLEGKSLREYIGDARVDLRTKLIWLADIARALGAAHERGLVHRDVKPENVMVCSDGTIKVLDFGIAKVTSTPHLSGDGPPSVVTMVGNQIGTPRYMAPEIILGQEADGRADQFAWGIVAYELLSGKHAWTSQDAPTQYGILNEAAPLLPLEAAGLPAEVRAIVTRSLEKAREDRFPSMLEIVSRLDVAVSAAMAEHRPSGATTDPGDEKTAVTAFTLDESSLPRQPAEFRPGEVIDARYEIVSVARRGSHAVVFRARDLKARTWVALKLLHSGGDEKRLRKELLVARSVTHPGVVRMYDLVEVGGKPALTMELLEGHTLAESILRGTTWTAGQWVELGLEIARALRAVHAARVVHSDLTASRIFLRTEGGLSPSNGRAVITGFSSARVLQGGHDAEPPSFAVSAEETDPAFAPPNVDVVGFGSLMLQAAIGSMVESAASGDAREVERRLAAARPDLPKPLVTCLVRCFESKPTDRFADGAVLLAALEAMGPTPISSTAVVAPALEATERQPGRNSEKKKSKRALWGLILAFVLAVVVGASIVLFLGGAMPAR